MLNQGFGHILAMHIFVKRAIGLVAIDVDTNKARGRKAQADVGFWDLSPLMSDRFSYVRGTMEPVGYERA